MPVRDPETGQFVSGNDGSNLTLADADDILYIRGGFTVDDGTNDSGGDHKSAVSTLTYAKDYEILGIEVDVVMEGEDVANGDSTAPGRVESARADVQVATSGGFTEDASGGAGGRMADGVYWQGNLQAQPPSLWEDDTNGSGGFASASRDDKVVFIPRSHIVNADTSPHSGTDLNIHGRVNGLAATGGSVEVQVEVKIWVAER